MPAQGQLFLGPLSPAPGWRTGGVKTSEQQTNGGEGKYMKDTCSSSECWVPERGQSDGRGNGEDVDPLNVVSTMQVSPG